MKKENNGTTFSTIFYLIVCVALIALVLWEQSYESKRTDAVDHLMRLNVNIAGVTFKKCIRNGNHAFTNTLEKPCTVQRLRYDNLLYLLDTWTINPNETVTRHINNYEQLRIFHNKSDMQPAGLYNFNCELK